MSSGGAGATWAWTEAQRSVAVLAAGTAATGGLAAAASSPYDVVGVLSAALTVAAALTVGALGGLAAGLGGAALVIAARRIGGAWTPDDLPLALALTAAFLFLGWLAGAAGKQLRQRGAEAPVAAGTAPAFGSLGLLPADLAQARLDEEITRARRHRRPLTLVLLRIRITEDGLSEGARRAALRTSARLVESLLPETAVPFALAADEVGAILPETDEAGAWELLGPVVDAASRASFSVRESDERRSLVDCAALQAGLLPLTRQHDDAEAVLTALRLSVSETEPTAPSAAPPLSTMTP